MNLDFFLEKIKSEKFEVTNLKESIPGKVINQLICLNGDFTLANPGQKYQDSDIIDEDEKLPSRGLKFLVISNKTIILNYCMSTGPGISSKYVLIDYDSNGINDFWCGNGIREIGKLEDLIIIIEKFKDESFPLGLQTNIFYF